MGPAVRRAIGERRLDDEHVAIAPRALRFGIFDAALRLGEEPGLADRRARRIRHGDGDAAVRLRIACALVERARQRGAPAVEPGPIFRRNLAVADRQADLDVALSAARRCCRCRPASAPCR